MINASGIEVKLSQAQQRAYDKLTDEWRSPYELQARLSTLEALVDMGIADWYEGKGAGFFPNTATYFRRKKV